MRIGLRNILTALLLSAATVPSFAQEGAYASYTPYSIFGVGDLLNQGSAYNSTMGGVGIASRTNRYMNYLNPASLTARVSLSVMMDFSVFQGNRLFRQGDLRSGANVFTLNDIAISFPFNRKTAMAVGMRPYSSVGYGYSYLYDNDGLGRNQKLYQMVNVRYHFPCLADTYAGIVLKAHKFMTAESIQLCIGKRF